MAAITAIIKSIIPFFNSPHGDEDASSRYPESMAASTSIRYIIISDVRFTKIIHVIVNTSINIIPAPRGLPTDFEPLIAYALPPSLGSIFFPIYIAKHVSANANNMLTNVTTFM